VRARPLRLHGLSASRLLLPDCASVAFALAEATVLANRTDDRASIASAPILSRRKRESFERRRDFSRISDLHVVQHRHTPDPAAREVRDVALRVYRQAAQQQRELSTGLAALRRKERTHSSKACT
jgi:hypothetical protein